MKQVKAMCGVEILEMTANGLQLIINIPTEKEVENPEDWAETLSTMINSAYENDKMYMVTEDASFCIRGLDKKTIVCRGVFTTVYKKEDEE